MPTLDISMTYTFGYLINEDTITDRKKRELAAKTCAQTHLEKLFNNLPSWFDKNLAGTRDYFKLVLGNSVIPDTPGYAIAGDAVNEDLPKYITKSVFSCVAEHLCSVVYPLSAKVEIFQGDGLDYGIEANLGYAKNMLQISTASEEWLDYWASYFVSPGRRNSEGDETLRDRVVNSLNQPKNTIDVIKQTLFNYLGYYPVIYELVDTGIHNPPISPVALTEVNNDFAHNAVKDIKRRACRIVIELKVQEPFDGAAYVSTPTNVVPAGAVQPDEWFVREPSRAGDPMKGSFSVDSIAIAGTITLATSEGDLTADLPTGRKIAIAGSSMGNDGVYTVSSATFFGGATVIDVVETPSANEGPALTGVTATFAVHVNRDEAYIFDPTNQIIGGITLEQLASIVRGVKAAGVKVYYKLGATGQDYAIV